MAERAFEISVEYSRERVTARIDNAIQEILKKAAREIHAKAALLSNPGTVTVASREFVEGKWQDMDLEITQ